MGARRSGREAALQMLFQLEGSGVSSEQAIELFWRTFEDADPEGKPYADAIVRGVADNLDGIDKKVTAASQNWRLERMSRVDRNLLRLGTWELMFRTDVPRAVILDEAVELAKSFGTDESSGFVNGVLDRIAENLGRRDEGRNGH
ncbi:MAG: Transcription termination protein NusB [Myxococcaceae bacterium]|jgi:N utilization substance protein B|nr:Transcription termination protein NusB [Myxococcaceae bacterium]MEA2752491.1 transcription antitermination protein NusB [Myxococcales bacterium]